MDVSLVDWSRAQFALTAIYHWLFVPLTLGLSFIIAFMESIYVKTGDEEWKKITKFWMTLFGVNFAIGVATGIILEFEFGTNWSNYSWFVGDIFGAPLAVEGIMAFFMESTFIAVMFFGWNKVSKKFHLVSTWLVAAGANLSALWILVANAWMQYPTGMHFNPETARNEMLNFWEVLFSPVAINKFLHTVTSGFVLSSVFVVGISAWYLLRKRNQMLAKRSMLIASVFGFVMSLFLILTGDGSARLLARHQPLKFAAMENLYEGQSNAPLVAVGILKNDNTEPKKKDFLMKLEIPGVLSFMAFQNFDAYVPGIRDLVHGNPEQGIISVNEKIAKGKLAIEALKEYKEAGKTGDTAKADSASAVLNSNFKYFGYGYLEKPQDAIPPIGPAFYSFRIMVALGMWFVLLFILTVFFVFFRKPEKIKWYLYLSVLSIPLAYLASETGWLVAEFGRQPWVIQDLMPASAAVSRLTTGSVQTTFILFAVTFTLLLIADIKIMSKQIKIGPKDGGEK
ncbi:MAG TPA: cytochrome ubiquinol oxidase subunit I [Bacteroidales bacterium]|nr:cytochrome ubiquinol oxidase subunit I [Bacteroidales bacterium]HPT01033.1 cytochrome ubiquinol oxidase subunit I [Bacteroidales bacterium]